MLVVGQERILYHGRASGEDTLTAVARGFGGTSPVAHKAGDTGCLEFVCVGDCSGNREVTIDEILRMVNIALGSSPVDECWLGDQDGNGEITVNEIVAAVNRALNGCA